MQQSQPAFMDSDITKQVMVYWKREIKTYVTITADTIKTKNPYCSSTEHRSFTGIRWHLKPCIRSRISNQFNSINQLKKNIEIAKTIKILKKSHIGVLFSSPRTSRGEGKLMLYPRRYPVKVLAGPISKLVMVLTSPNLHRWCIWSQLRI